MGIVPLPDIRLFCSKNKMYADGHIKNFTQVNNFLATLNCLHFFDNTICRTKDTLNKFLKITEETISTFKNGVKPGKM